MSMASGAAQTKAAMLHGELRAAARGAVCKKCLRRFDTEELSVTCGFFPAVDLDFFSVPRVALEYGFPSCPALGPQIGRKMCGDKKNLNPKKS